MSLPIYQRVAVTDAGDVIPGAEYTVINENTGVAAPIYSDRTGATLLSPPYFADSVGTIQFFIAQGTTFRVAASGGVGTYTDRYVYGVSEAALIDASGDSYIPGTAYVGSIRTDVANLSTNVFSRDGGAALYVQQVDSTSDILQLRQGNGQAGTGAQQVTVKNDGTTLIGKTSVGSAAGVQIEPSGAISLVRSGSPALYLDRTTSNGTIIDIRKSGTTIGSVGVGNSNDLHIGNADTGVCFFDNERIMPWNPATNSIRNAEIFLGDSNARYKVLYLSGVADVGSIVTANDNLSVNKISREGGPSLYLQQVDSTNNILQGHSASGTPGGGTLRISVAWNGDVKNSNNSYGGLSDQKLKENITDASSQWDDLKAVRLRNYSMISDEETSANRLGVIAQELEAAGMGGLVDESDDLDENEERLGTTTKSVKYSILYMKAVGALQEAQTRIESLETLTQSLATRIEALEGK